MKKQELKNFCTMSINCANCKRAKKGKWNKGLYFCICKKGELLDGNNQEHYENCPYYKQK